MPTKIEWTDETWNPITGCELKSEGCRYCYAARLAATRMKNHPSRRGLARLNAAAGFEGLILKLVEFFADAETNVQIAIDRGAGLLPAPAKEADDGRA